MRTERHGHDPFTRREALHAGSDTRIDHAVLRRDARFLVIRREERQHSVRALKQLGEFVDVGVVGLRVRYAWEGLLGRWVAASQDQDVVFLGREEGIDDFGCYACGGVSVWTVWGEVVERRTSCAACDCDFNHGAGWVLLRLESDST
jgi:hypothetical protein